MSNWRFEDRVAVVEFIKRTGSCPICLEPMESVDDNYLFKSVKFLMCNVCRHEWRSNPTSMSLLVYINNRPTNLCATCGEPCRADDYLCKACRA